MTVGGKKRSQVQKMKISFKISTLQEDFLKSKSMKVLVHPPSSLSVTNHSLNIIEILRIPQQ